MISISVARPRPGQRFTRPVVGVTARPSTNPFRTGPTDGRDTPAPTTLRDGSQVLIRPIERTDGPTLVDGFERLSPRSRRSRFLGSKPELSPADVRYFTDVDHHDHVALLALSLVDGRAVGTARFVRDADDPRGADVAVTVVDEWHRRGVATALIKALVDRAEDEGVEHFVAHVAEDNLAIVRLLQRIDAAVVLVDQASGVFVLSVTKSTQRQHSGISR